MRKYSSFIIGGALGLVFAGYAAFAAFQLPTGSPPSGNVEPPINTSTATQIKAGALVLNQTAGTPTGLQIKGYLDLDTVPGAPPPGDCDANTRGRMIVEDSATPRLWICVLSGAVFVWKSALLL